MYQVYEIPDGAAQLLEQLGNKYKFWFIREDKKWMFKEGRANTGEDWAEKVASEICHVLNVPCAVYDFAEYEGKFGVMSESIVPDDGMLILGNELLARVKGDYDVSNKGYHQTDYTILRVLASLRNKDIRPPLGWTPPAGILSAPDVFVGYLMVDVLIGNQDRHHENWGVVLLDNKGRHLAHTFDQASSLGRNESDEKRSTILNTKDERQHISSYVTRAKSAFFSLQTKRRISTLEAFQEANRYHPEAARTWINQLNKLDEAAINKIIGSIPDSIMSGVAKDFAHEMLKLNTDRLLKYEEA